MNFMSLWNHYTVKTIQVVLSLQNSICVKLTLYVLDGIISTIYTRTSIRVSGSCYLPNSCLIHNTRRKNTSHRNIQRDAIVSRLTFVQRHETQRERARRFIDQTDENLTKGAENPMCVFNERDNKT